jgi:dihydrofolate synthase/folylpolyglutamate synthase
MALKFFADRKCDLVIWETGLGGRLDATNIVTPLAAVITNIALDHQQWLGDTLDKIAAEKAGIIKPGVPVVTATDAPAALAVIAQVAGQRHAPLTLVPASPSPAVPLPLAGEHQRINAALALATVKVLQPQIPVPDDAIRAGLATVDWPGRLQLVPQPDGGRILLDGAHNPAGATALRAALERDYPGHPVLIFGALADKNWREICKILAPLPAKVFTVPVASKRSAAAAEIADAFRAANPRVEVTALASLAEAINACEHDSYIVITGSLYLVGEALERLGLSAFGPGERGLNEWTTPQIRG